MKNQKVDLASFHAKALEKALAEEVEYRKVVQNSTDYAAIVRAAGELATRMAVIEALQTVADGEEV